MNETRRGGLFADRGWLWTRSADPGHRVYGEHLRQARGAEFRSWNPQRSKLGAYATKLPDAPWPDVTRDVLYLGAASGTTVSHVSDMLAPDRVVYAVEFSPRSLRDLVWSLAARTNVIPVLADAGKPERYAAYLDRPVGTIIQDVAQRHQVEIFLRNMPLLAPDGTGFLFVKARSIDVARPVEAIYQDAVEKVTRAGLRIVAQVDLAPFERDHAAFVVRRK